MFYRFTKSNMRVPVDLDGIYEGSSCFLAGGSPILLKENLELLKHPEVTVISMNNTASIVPTNIWVGGDKPLCYSPKILMNPNIIHFGVISRRDFEVKGTKWKHLPNTYFFGTTDKFSVDDLLKPHRDLVWWKNTFYMAIQLAYRLGFRKIYLIGCQFKIENDSQYSYKANLDNEMVEWNKKTYAGVVANMKFLKQHFDDYGFKVISCTSDSPLNEFYPTMFFNDAVKEIIKDYPAEYNTESCPHSSVFKKEQNK